MPNRTVLLLGAAGSGKSTTANLLILGPTLCNTEGKTMFPIVLGAAGGTQMPKKGIKDGLTVIDTVGLFHAEESPETALERLVDALEMASNGIDVVAMVTAGRMQQDTYESFKYIERLLGEEECKKRLLLITTKTGELADKDYETQINFMKEQMRKSPGYENIVKATGGLSANRWILTEVPDIAEKKKKEQLFVEDRAEVLERLTAKIGLFNAGKFIPKLALKNRVIHQAIIQACNEALTANDDLETKRMIDDITKEANDGYRQALTKVTQLEMTKLVKEHPHWIQQTEKLLKGLANLKLNDNAWKGAAKGAAAGMGLGAVTGEIFGPIGASIGAGMGAFFGGIAGYFDAIATAKQERQDAANAITESQRKKQQELVATIKQRAEQYAKAANPSID